MPVHHTHLEQPNARERVSHARKPTESIPCAVRKARTSTYRRTSQQEPPSRHCSKICLKNSPLKKPPMSQRRLKRRQRRLKRRQRRLRRWQRSPKHPAKRRRKRRQRKTTSYQRQSLHSPTHQWSRPKTANSLHSCKPKSVLTTSRTKKRPTFQHRWRVGR